MFGEPILKITYEDDDSDNEEPMQVFDVYFKKIILASTKGTYFTTDIINVKQLTGLIRNNVLHIKELQSYYPNIDTIFIELFRCDDDTKKNHKIIVDVSKREDVYNKRSVRNGINLVKDLI